MSGVGELGGWNAADGARFARPFADDADFVNVSGEHLRRVKSSRRDTKRSSIRFTQAASSATGKTKCERSPGGPPGSREGHTQGTDWPTRWRAPLTVYAGAGTDQNAWNIAGFHNTLVTLPS